MDTRNAPLAVLPKDDNQPMRVRETKIDSIVHLYLYRLYETVLLCAVFLNPCFVLVRALLLFALPGGV